jgi:hypothetical protein
MIKTIIRNSKNSQFKKMEIAIFEPISTGDGNMFGFIALGAILCLAIGLWGLKMKQQLAWMLGFFGVVILGGNAAFMKFSESYVTPITIYENRVDTPKGIVDFDDLLSARIVTEGLELKTFSSESPEKVLILERRNQKGVLLAESQYPIIQIKQTIDQQIAIHRAK